jgi:hypothetical protein
LLIVYAARMPSKPLKTSISTVRLDAEDLKLISALKKHLGASSNSQILRMGLRSLAREHKRGVP